MRRVPTTITITGLQLSPARHGEVGQGLVIELAKTVPDLDVKALHIDFAADQS